MTATRYPADEGPAAHVANGLQLLIIVRGELEAIETRLHAALELLEGGANKPRPPAPDGP